MDKALQREKTRERVKRYRNKQKGVTGEALHNNDSAYQLTDLTPTITETVPASYVIGTQERIYEMLPQRERYLTLSDNQVLDRLNQPTCDRMLSGVQIQAMLKANDSVFGYVPSRKKLPDELRKRLTPQIPTGALQSKSRRA